MESHRRTCNARVLALGVILCMGLCACNNTSAYNGKQVAGATDLPVANPSDFTASTAGQQIETQPVTNAETGKTEGYVNTQTGETLEPEVVETSEAVTPEKQLEEGEVQITEATVSEDEFIYPDYNYKGFVGNYQDSVSQRATMSINENDNNSIHITINWANSVSEYEQWQMDGIFENNKIVYSNCKHNVITEDSNKPAEDVTATGEKFDVSAGYFTLYTTPEGLYTLKWDGAPDIDCRICEFEPVVDLDTAIIELYNAQPGTAGSGERTEVALQKLHCAIRQLGESPENLGEYLKAYLTEDWYKSHPEIDPELMEEVFNEAIY